MIVCVLDIAPLAFKYSNFNILGSSKFSDDIGTFIVTAFLYSICTSFSNSKSADNPSDLANILILSTTPVIGSMLLNCKSTKFRLFCVTVLEPLLMYCIL